MLRKPKSVKWRFITDLTEPGLEKTDPPTLPPLASDGGRNSASKNVNPWKNSTSEKPPNERRWRRRWSSRVAHSLSHAVAHQQFNLHHPQPPKPPPTHPMVA
ncbi:hypothetical protein ACOSQ3_020358 [Xanthoceras sorbifolium]